MKKLSGLDAIFLHAETPRTPMNVVATVLLEPGAAAAMGEDLLSAVVTRIEERISHLPPFRRRLAGSGLSLDAPSWIEDPDFTVAEHVFRMRIAAPGEPEDLERLVGIVASRPLDRTRPLWELWVIDGLADGSVALVIKAHHAALDGVSGAALLLHLFDRDSEPPVPAPEGQPALPTTATQRMRETTRRMQELAGAAREAGGGLGRLLRARLGDAAPVRDAPLPFSAPTVSFSGSISSRRVVSYSRTPLEDVATVRKAFGGTVNDVVLAACTTALRDYLIARNELPDRALVASIPVSTRRVCDEPGGNHISAMLAELPVHIDDPLHRYWEGCRATRRAKRLHGLLGGRTLGALAELARGPALGLAARLYSDWGLADRHAPLHNLIVSNVPGPPVPLRFAGSAVRALHPHGPLMDGAGLNITVMSHAGSLDVGVLACGESVREPGSLARGVAAAVRGLTRQAEHQLDEGVSAAIPLLRAVG